MKKIALAGLLLTVFFPGGHSLPEVNNVTLEMEIDAGTVYADGTELSGSFSTESFANAYVVTNHPAGIIGYSKPIRISYEEGAPDVLSVVQEQGDFIVPFSRGGVGVLQDDIDDVGEGFLNEVSPAFGYEQEIRPVVRASYVFPFNVTRYESSGSMDELVIRNRVTGGNETELYLRAR